MATLKSGKYGQVLFGASAYGEATSWNMTDEVDTTRFGTFGGGGFKKTVGGQRSANGSVEGKYDFNMPVEDFVGPGDEVVLKLYIDTTKFYQMSAVIKSLQINVNGDSGEPVSWTMQYESNGTITEPA